jgi:hypothetical protein
MRRGLVTGDDPGTGAPVPYSASGPVREIGLMRAP